MKTSYSQAWLRRRVGRRRALGTLAGAGLLIGGAGGASTRETPTTVSVATPAGAATAGAAAGATAQPTATAQAKRGGVFRNAALDGPPHLDPHLTTNTVTWGFGVGLWYSRLVKYDAFAPQPGTVPAPD